ncbi:MAG: NAD(P)/FAD-dependent oxidoreductase [Bryobacteraceae bacterium]|jgi:NADH dehydrogenase
MGRHRVVILGGGFGGLYTAKALRKAAVEVTLVDKRNFHLFQPLLYQVATGSLSPGEIASPLRSVLSRQQNTRVLLGEAVDLDPQRRTLILADGEIPYDTLVVATGARDAWFGHDEWAQHAAPLKTIEEAVRIRHRILYAFEAAEREHDPEKRRQWLTFIVVGAGATGVELAGALGEIANDTLKHDFRSIDPKQARILLLDGASRVLPPYPEELSRKAEASLIRVGVRPYTGVRVVGIDDSGVNVEHGDGRTEHLAARTVIWAAGVRASAFGEVLARRAGATLERAGRVVVGPDLSLPGYPEIFVIGDLAHYTDSQGRPLPGVAQVAMQQGSFVARLIGQRAGGARNKPFRYRDRGDLAVIGRAAAVARIGGLHLSGFPAWLIWLFVHLMYLVEFSNRLLVFIHWGFLYLTFNRGARLITGAEGSEES